MTCMESPEARENLHRLIDQLPERDLDVARDALTYEAAYVRLLRQDRDDLRALLAHIYAQTSASPTCEVCARVTRDAEAHGVTRPQTGEL